MKKNILVLVKKANSLARKKLDDYDSKKGVSSLSCVIIDYLCYCEAKDIEVTQKDLEKEFYLSKSTCSDLVNNLETSNYIVRTVDESDARKKRIVTLPKGKELHEYNMKKFKDVEDDFCSPLSKEEKAELERLLMKIVTNKKGGKLNGKHNECKPSKNSKE